MDKSLTGYVMQWFNGGACSFMKNYVLFYLWWVDKKKNKAYSIVRWEFPP